MSSPSSPRPPPLDLKSVCYHIHAHVQHPQITRTFCRSATNDYTILNYVGKSDKVTTATHQKRRRRRRQRRQSDDELCLRDYRSVILDWATWDAYSMSPPTSVSIEEFFTHIPGGCKGYVDHQRILVNEWVEGTMINVWFDSNAGRWEISTKNTVGGRYTYHRNHHFEEVDDPTIPSIHLEHVGNKSFRNMFVEAITGEVRQVCDGYVEHSLCDTMDTLNLSKHYSYSFVIQHPENHLVMPSDVPCVYLVAVYYVPHMPYLVRTDVDASSYSEELTYGCRSSDEYGITEIQLIDHDLYETWPELTSIPHIKFPRRIPAMTYSSLFHTYSSIHTKLCDVGMGVCLTDRTTGIRTKMMSAVYTEWKEFRAIQPNLLFQYLCLKYAKKLDDFLVHFPGYAESFDYFQYQHSMLLVNIHLSYVSYYIHRTGEPISARFMPYIYHLHHDVFLPSKATTTTKKITLDVVREYMDSFSPEETFWHMVHVGSSIQPNIP